MSNDTTQHTPANVRERVDVPGLPDGITPLTGVFTTHHAGRPHAIVLWQGAPWLVWQHPDGHWVTEAKVQVAALLRTPRGEGEDSRLAPIVRAILERIDRYQAFHDRVGPADLTLPPVARTITEEEIFALRAALLRTPRGEGEEEAWCAFLDALDEFEAAAALWADPEGPTAADMERLRQSRQRVIECAGVLAARRGEGGGE